ncbi:hypothetical protein COS93_01345 [bacterium (Candidatus Gribaldobacteria) CG07_land_8_20_14_0_80_33_18]|uniref:Outer membrane protein beta-barrel domain-containing protein n=1 Tax=bacterium (Candidatus Gribaldobacteria) CG07_land_8_20_14_0_80_33_18 TaxID=2014272 RepID=A0A2M6Z3N9_9BACT|nr:MAG: hypothetical protein COU04_00975 [bacterium (Candidatus Gribaldobacteria) CG10_big_fil_rev_8_21_14_0_10_33_41]PIU46937.1 MAG: hypothetical protein COS93_01345 [bacterium (Candidatus Gribaldobacteria) CG07_land_8_20_14_0_80_33_18]PJA01280.1 MAG: hypothetical protein COX75_00245 [bacterium (Candidatus Gribaldobacteria) CG_4_10_14_0_2_um_filter_33_15]PJB08633.1 MAG: hypothetical protein CO122_01325 [bacterium (Candidatus Gribaldobacteria) CG_4_9_14_3_um_filter_33_9]
MKRMVIVLALIFVLFGIKTAEAAKIWTGKGDVIIGEIVEMTEEKLVVKTRFGTIELLKKDVVKIEGIEESKKERETKKEAKIGLGGNWLGFHLRYVVTESILAEGKIQFASNNTLLGLRGYYLLKDKEIKGNIPIIPYIGIEIGLPLSGYLTGGYLIGGFGGTELKVAKNIALDFDAGLYWVGLKSVLGEIGDLGLIFNLGISYYF